MSLFFNAEDGFYSITSAGIILFVVVVIALVILTALLKSKDKSTSFFSTKQLVFSAVSLALAYALSYVKLFRMPWGGSVTLCSMFFVTIIGYWFGPKIGLTTALAYGLLQFIQSGGSYILTPMQVMYDYILAFMALGVSGFFAKRKNGLTMGYIIAILLRGVFHSIGGYLYWMEYMPDNFPKSLTAIYPICYNFAYIIAEGMITVVIILLPPVKKGIAQITQMERE